MQKSQFEYIALILKESKAPQEVVINFADRLSSTNPLFKRDRFMKAAYEEGSPSN